jgi:hypothetical protein
MTEKQGLTEIIEGLKREGFIYNDADFCRKTGLKSSFVSEMKAGKKPFSEKTRQLVEQTFPNFFYPKTVNFGNDLNTLFNIIQEHDIRFHELANRILDAMGVAPVTPKPKEKTA